jgi:uncharacterized protein (DUF1810 family)
MDKWGLSRFLEAQNEVYEKVFAELANGRKETHWMWFIFPQLKGLGHSPTAQYYGIYGLEEAKRFLAAPLLGQRLRECVAAVLQHQGTPLLHILGSPDDLKFCSSMTLFLAAAESREDRQLFRSAIDTFCDSALDSRTMEMIAQTS